MHNVVMDRYCRFVVDISSDLRRPTSVTVFAVGESTLELLFVLHDSEKTCLTSGNFAPPELISFKTSDEFGDLHAALYLPDPKVTKII